MSNELTGISVLSTVLRQTKRPRDRVQEPSAASPRDVLKKAILPTQGQTCVPEFKGGVSVQSPFFTVDEKSLELKDKCLRLSRELASLRAGQSEAIASEVERYRKAYELLEEENCELRKRVATLTSMLDRYMQVAEVDTFDDPSEFDDVGIDSRSRPEDNSLGCSLKPTGRSSKLSVDTRQEAEDRSVTQQPATPSTSAGSPSLKGPI